MPRKEKINEFNSGSHLGIAPDFDKSIFGDCVCSVCENKIKNKETVFVIVENSKSIFDKKTIDKKTLIHFNCIMHYLKNNDEKFFGKLLADFL